MLDKKRDDLGYGNPPQSGRFQKGTSGNPKGRPKGSQNLSTIFRKVINQKVVIKENGIKKKVTKGEAVALQLTNKAAAGDVSAAKEIIRLAEAMEQMDFKNTPPRNVTITFVHPKPRKTEGSAEEGDR